MWFEAVFLLFQNLSDRQKLPVFSYREEILNAVQNNPVIIIRGATGCGKTTQIPQFIMESYLEQGRGAECNIYVTQPRRISAVSVSERVAYERGKKDIKESKHIRITLSLLLLASYELCKWCVIEASQSFLRGFWL